MGWSESSLVYMCYLVPSCVLQGGVGAVRGATPLSKREGGFCSPHQAGTGRKEGGPFIHDTDITEALAGVRVLRTGQSSRKDKAQPERTRYDTRAERRRTAAEEAAANGRRVLGAAYGVAQSGAGGSTLPSCHRAIPSLLGGADE
jgi:hypothetical protein